MKTITQNFSSQIVEFSTFSTDKTISTGPVAQMDLNRHGKIEVKFYFGRKTIGLSIAGFHCISIFHLFPLHQKQCLANQYWMERYVMKCHHASDIIQAITKIQTHHHNPFNHFTK